MTSCGLQARASPRDHLLRSRSSSGKCFETSSLLVCSRGGYRTTRPRREVRQRHLQILDVPAPTRPRYREGRQCAHGCGQGRQGTQGSESLSAQGCPLAAGRCECVSTCVCVWAPLAKRHRWLSLQELGLVRQQAWTVHSRIRALRAHGGRVECPSRRMVSIDAVRVNTGRGSVTNRKCARDVETRLHVQTQTHTARPCGTVK